MKKRVPKSERRDENILGFEAFRAITAVEGLHLSRESEARVRKLVSGKLTPAQRRAEVMKAYTGKAGK